MIADLKSYPDYKDLGLAWLGRVPANWSRRRMKFLFTERVEKGFPEEPLLAATQSKGVVRKQDYGTRTVTATKDFHLLKLVRVDDFVISLRSFQGGIELAHSQGIISPAYTILTSKSEALGGYYARLFKSADFIQSLTLFVTGIREGQNIDYERLSRAFLPLPPVADQVAIGRFLDWANGRLERTIRAKRKVIALLNEQKQAIIHRAVTRGLDPNVALKPSGVPWIGLVPEHWRVVRNSALFSHRVEAGVTGLPVLQVSLRSGITHEARDQFGREKRLIADHSKYKLIRQYDLAYNTMRMWQGAVGVCPNDGLVSPAYVVLRPRNGVDSRYYEFIFRTAVYKQQVNRSSTGIVSDRNRLYWDNFKQMPNLLLPIVEQDKICQFIRDQTASLTTATSRLDREIDLLREYRNRLVADVVTGKLDVRDAAALLPQEGFVTALDDTSTLTDETELAEDEGSA